MIINVLFGIFLISVSLRAIYIDYKSLKNEEVRHEEERSNFNLLVHAAKPLYLAGIFYGLVNIL